MNFLDYLSLSTNLILFLILLLVLRRRAPLPIEPVKVAATFLGRWWPVLHRLIVWVGISVCAEARSFIKSNTIEALAAMSTPKLIWVCVDGLFGMAYAGLITIRLYTDSSLAKHLDQMAQTTPPPTTQPTPPPTTTS